jgi:hypothetical protein
MGRLGRPISLVAIFAVICVQLASSQTLEAQDTSGSQSASQVDLQLEATEPLATPLYLRQRRLYTACPADQPPPVSGCVAADGAANVNALWEAGLAHHWYIEDQRGASLLIIGGLVRADNESIATGLRMIDWGFAHQLPDGSFDGTGDAFHSTSFFVESVAHSLLVLQGSPHADRYARVIARDNALVHLAALWMIRPDVWQRGMRRDRPYTHRRYLVAAALGETAVLTGDAALRGPMDEAIDTGLRLQRADGVNPERGGFDSSYQAVGLEYAARWLTYLGDSDTRATAVMTMVQRGLTWEASRVADSGEVYATGNTRTGNGQENTRAGVPKTVSYSEVIRAFGYFGLKNGDTTWIHLAERIAGFKGWLTKAA